MSLQTHWKGHDLSMVWISRGEAKERFLRTAEASLRDAGETRVKGHLHSLGWGCEISWLCLKFVYTANAFLITLEKISYRNKRQERTKREGR